MQEVHVHVSSPLKRNRCILLSLFFTITSSYLSAQESWLVWPGSGNFRNNYCIDLEKGSVGTNLENYHLHVIEGPQTTIIARSNTKIYALKADEKSIYDFEKTPLKDEVPSNRLIVNFNGGKPCQFLAMTTNGAALVELNLNQPAIWRFCKTSERDISQITFYLPPTNLQVTKMDADAILTWKGSPGAGYGIWIKRDAHFEFHSRVTEPKCILKQLQPNQVLSIRVAREISPLLFSEWAEVSVSGALNPDIKIGTIKGDKPFSFSTGKRSTEDIWLINNHSIRPGQNGAVKIVGNGSDLFEKLEWAPLHGYVQEISRVDKDDVMVVRTPDGRFAKLLCHNDHAEYVFLAEGGTYFGGGPKVTSTLIEENQVKIATEEKLHKGESLVFYKKSPNDGMKRIAETTDSFIVDKEMQRGDRVKYGVTRRSASGIESGLSYTTSDNLPLHWKRETVTMNAGARDQYSFEPNKTIKRADEYDMKIVSTAGSASSLQISVPYGGIEQKAEKINELLAMNYGALERRLSTTVIRTDCRYPSSQSFFLRTSRMNIVYVTIVKTFDMKITFDYVILRRTVNEMITELKANVVKGSIDEVKSVRKYIKELAQDDFDMRSNAQKTLNVIGSKALDELFEAYESSPIEVKTRIAQIIEEIWSRWKVINNENILLNKPKDIRPAGEEDHGIDEL